MKIKIRNIDRKLMDYIELILFWLIWKVYICKKDLKKYKSLIVYDI